MNQNKKQLRVVQISKYDSAGGGASRVAEQLTEQLINRGHKVTHYTRGAKKGFNKVRRPLYGIQTKKMMGWLLGRGWVDVVPFELLYLLLNPIIWRAEIIHFHDISGTASPLSITVLSRFKNVVWTLHDLSPLTGGCIHPLKCQTFDAGCGNCPQLGSWPLETAIDKTDKLVSFRRWCLKNSHADLVSPSKWLADMVQRRAGKSVTIINNGVDTNIFKPYAGLLSDIDYRGTINEIETGDKVKILISAALLDNPYKGTDTALSIIQGLPANKIKLVIMGSALQDVGLGGYEVVHLGYIADDRYKAAIFSAVDVLLFCSRGENYPLTLLESIACGNVIFALNTGGVPEVLDKAKVKVIENDRESLLKRLRSFLDDPMAFDRETIRVDTEISLVHCVTTYIKHYRLLLKH